MTGFTFTPLPITGAVLITSTLHTDARGTFQRSFCETSFRQAGIPTHFPQHNISGNPTRHTLRGLHYQQGNEYKIVRCLHGSAFDVITDLREDSPTYGTWHAVELSAQAAHYVYIPAGCAHGFLTLEADTTLHYLMGEAYRPDAQRGIHYRDPQLNILWPADPALISERDLAFPTLRGSL